MILARGSQTRIVEKRPLSTGASREALVDKCARRYMIACRQRTHTRVPKDYIDSLFGADAQVSDLN